MTIYYSLVVAVSISEISGRKISDERLEMRTDKRFWYGLMAAAVLLGGAWIWVSRVQTAGGGAGDDVQTAPQ